MRDFIIAALDDDHGVNENAYNALVSLARYAGDYGEDIDDIVAAVKSTDGRYYLPKGHGLQ